MRIELEPIAYVETVQTKVEDDYWGGEESCLTLSERFKPEALQGIEEFSHAEVIFFLDRIDSSKITMGARETGIPERPGGLSLPIGVKRLSRALPSTGVRLPSPLSPLPRWGEGSRWFFFFLSVWG